jgi:hypothetical protein
MRSASWQGVQFWIVIILFLCSLFFRSFEGNKNNTIEITHNDKERGQYRPNLHAETKGCLLHVPGLSNIGTGNPGTKGKILRNRLNPILLTTQTSHCASMHLGAHACKCAAVKFAKFK